MVGKTKQLELNKLLGKWVKLNYHRGQSVVKVSVMPGSPLVGMTNKGEIQKGIIASSLTMVVDGNVITSILNTTDTEINVQESLVELDEINLAWQRDSCTEFES